MSDQKSDSTDEHVIHITQLRDCLGVADSHVKTTGEPIIIQRWPPAARHRQTAEEGRRYLSETCLDNDLLAALAEVTQRQRAANNRRCELEREIRELREGSRSDLHQTKFAQWPSKIEKLEKRSEYRKAKADALEPRLAEVHAAIADLDKREKELREQLLEP